MRAENKTKCHITCFIQIIKNYFQPVGIAYGGVHHHCIFIDCNLYRTETAVFI